MLTVKQVFTVGVGRRVVVLTAEMPTDLDAVVVGSTLQAGMRRWRVKERSPGGNRPGQLDVELEGGDVLSERLELRVVGQPMGGAEFARTADYLAKISRLLTALDLESFVAVAGPGTEPLKELALLLVQAQRYMKADEIDALTGGPNGSVKAAR